MVIKYVSFDYYIGRIDHQSAITDFNLKYLFGDFLISYKFYVE